MDEIKFLLWSDYTILQKCDTVMAQTMYILVAFKIVKSLCKTQCCTQKHRRSKLQKEKGKEKANEFQIC